MKKPHLCLALSVSISLANASLLPGYSEPTDGSIWQKLSHVSTKPTESPSAKLHKQVVHTPVLANRIHTQSVQSASSKQVFHGGASGYSMLFLSGKKDDGSSSGSAPAAALTIHPSLPDSAAIASDSTPIEPLHATELPSLMALNDTPRTSEIPSDDDFSTKESVTKEIKKPLKVASGRNLLAQLAPDQVIAQADQPSSITATPIPPVVTGTVDLEEFKTTNVIDLKVSQSRTFKLKNKIVRTSISDPSIAEPVVVAENQMVLLGKSPGGATLVIWDDAGNSVAIDLRVTRDYSQLQSTLREIDPRIIVKTFTVGGSDRVLLLGDVDHPESIIRAFSAANVFMDDRGMVVSVANSRLINARIGEQGGSGQAGAGQAGAFAQLGSVDRYTFFGNLNNNIGKAQVITSDGGRVTSLVKVRKVPLIVLHVTFMEMNTAAVRELGVQLGLNFTSGGFGFAVGGNNSSGASIAPQLLTTFPGITGTTLTGGASTGYVAQSPSFLSANTVTLTGPTPGTTSSLPITGFGLGVLNTVPALIGQSVLLGAPGGASFSPGGLANLYTSIANITSSTQQRFGINPTVQGIISHSRARVLAEPTLVTISGERAAFLAGGEIPILQAIATAGAAQQSVTFEPFGMRINMIPVLLENGTINIEVSPEERLISNAFPLNIPGSTTSVPGFTTRKAQTIVELKPGQELFISGLVTTNSGRELDKTPVIGEIPVLGALYRSKAFAKNESELVIAVRPEVILPGTPGQLKLPEEIGRVEGPRDMNLFQVEPTVIDERHYTSGRAERHQKTSPTLPEGSPIPDNN